MIFERPLGPAECWTVLSTARSGRVALTQHALPIVCPVSYDLDGESIRLVISSPALDRAALERHVVCFQAEAVDVLGVLRSVTAVGPLELVGADGSIGEAAVRIARLGTPLISGVAFGGPPAVPVSHDRRPVVGDVNGMKRSPEMFTRIAVPVDGSPRSFAAVRVGSWIADRRGATLEAVMVVRPRTDPAVEQNWLSQQLLRQDGLPVAATAVTLGGESVAASVARYLADGPPTLLVMSSTGRGRSAAMFGSTAEDLLAASSGPVLVVGPEAGDGAAHSGEVVVPLDGSPLAESAIDLTAQWCAGDGAPVRVVTVVPTAAGSQPDLDAYERRYVEHVAGGLQDRLGRPVECEVLHGGSPAWAIAEHAELTGAGMIVMSTHGRSGLRRIVLGSVAADVIHRASCPVLVERPPRPIAEAAETVSGTARS